MSGAQTYPCREQTHTCTPPYTRPLFCTIDQASTQSFLHMTVDPGLYSHQSHPLPAQGPSAVLRQPAETTAPLAPVAHPPSAQQPVQAPQSLPRQQVETRFLHQ